MPGWDDEDGGAVVSHEVRDDAEDPIEESVDSVGGAVELNEGLPEHRDRSREHDL